MLGELVQGASLVVEYDPARLPGCQTRHGGMPAWDLYAHVAFRPSGQIVVGNLVRHLAAGPTGPRVLDPPESVPFAVTVPLDAEQAELGFATRSATEPCVAWDSRYGENYRFPVTRSGPAPQVVARPGATPSLEMVNVVAGSAQKKDVFPDRPDRSPEGRDMETWLAVTAWVANVAYLKNVWVDVHIFDDHDALCEAETVPLSWVGPGGGGGDLFRVDQRVYQGFTATPGSVSPRPDARTVQHRLYYAVDGGLYTDRLLHQYQLPSDQDIR